LEQIRAFIAIQATDEVRKLVKQIAGELEAAGADVKWVEPENVHLTLKFLGNITLEDVGKLKPALDRALQGCRSLLLTVAGVGCFPGGRQAPRVVWIGLEGDLDALREIAAGVEEACAGLGFEREKRAFKAHLTIGRVRRGSSRLEELSRAVDRIAFKPLKLRVDRVNLVRSRLSPRGPTYTVMESVDLSD
jgi:2'-5' RNA ligase